MSDQCLRFFTPIARCFNFIRERLLCISFHLDILCIYISSVDECLKNISMKIFLFFMILLLTPVSNYICTIYHFTFDIWATLTLDNKSFGRPYLVIWVRVTEVQRRLTKYRFSLMFKYKSTIFHKCWSRKRSLLWHLQMENLYCKTKVSQTPSHAVLCVLYVRK